MLLGVIIMVFLSLILEWYILMMEGKSLIDKVKFQIYV